MGETEPEKVPVSCPICGNVEPPFWWLSEDINPTIKCEPYKNAFVFYPNFMAAAEAWGPCITEGLTNDGDLVS